MTKSINDVSSIYYNLRQYNDGVNTIVPLKVDNSRTDNVLENPSEWQLSVERFTIPASNIPIFIFRDGIYKIMMKYQNQEFMEEVEFIAGSPDPTDKSVRHYTTFFEMINNTMEIIYLQIISLYPAVALIVRRAPFFTFDTSSSNFALYGDIGMNDPINGIELSYNRNLINKFDGIPTKEFVDDLSLLPQRFILQFQAEGENVQTFEGITYYRMSSEYSTIYLWGGAKQIRLKTNNIPLNHELYPDNQDNTVLSDFEISPSEIVNRSSYQFSPKGERRFYDLISHYPLRRIDITAYWLDELENEHPIRLNFGDIFTMKLLFTKKSNTEEYEYYN